MTQDKCPTCGESNVTINNITIHIDGQGLDADQITMDVEKRLMRRARDHWPVYGGAMTREATVPKADDHESVYHSAH